MTLYKCLKYCSTPTPHYTCIIICKVFPSDNIYCTFKPNLKQIPQLQSFIKITNRVIVHLGCLETQLRLCRCRYALKAVQIHIQLNIVHIKYVIYTFCEKISILDASIGICINITRF